MLDYNIIKKIKTRPKISIIITVYNGEKYLIECLESIKAQTLSEIEIICVDDGSIDNSYNILEKYAKKDDRFKVIKKEHSNAGDSRNLGIKNARGKYLLFLDCDDYFNKDLCKDTYNKAKLFDADIVFFEYETLVDDGNKKELEKIPLDSNILCDCTFSAKQIQDKLFQITAPCAWSKLFKISKSKKYK